MIPNPEERQFEGPWVPRQKCRHQRGVAHFSSAEIKELSTLKCLEKSCSRSQGGNKDRKAGRTHHQQAYSKGETNASSLTRKRTRDSRNIRKEERAKTRSRHCVGARSLRVCIWFLRNCRGDTMLAQEDRAGHTHSH